LGSFFDGGVPLFAVRFARRLDFRKLPLCFALGCFCRCGDSLYFLLPVGAFFVQLPVQAL